MSERWISKKDKDLLVYDWYTNEEGWLVEDMLGLNLAHMVAQRQFMPWTKRNLHPLPDNWLVTFKNNNMLDCRRHNLEVWWRYDGSQRNIL